MLLTLIGSHIDRFFARPLRGDERVRVRQLFRRFLDKTALVLRSLTSGRAALPTRTWPITWLFIRVTWVLLLIHVLEITVWALFHLWWECLPDAGSAFYFSGVTCATIGYGELVLPKPWRMLAPIEGLTGTRR